MKSIGTFLMVMGAGSAVLYFFNMEFKLLMWVENWGPGIAWAIRGGLMLVGAGLMLAGRKSEATAS